MSRLERVRGLGLALCLTLMSVPGVRAADEQPAASEEALNTLKQLMEVEIVTASRRQQALPQVFTNVSVVTAVMIDRRGYRNLIELLEDVPGFDFATYEDGGGEYPNHSIHRGIGGDPGNTKLLILVDGIVQNQIAFHWSQGLTNEQMLHDVERVEVIHGPGSALYGANAYSGIVHIITKNAAPGTSAKLWLGEQSTWILDLMHAGKAKGFDYQLAFRSYLSDGDGGRDRPDPDGYFRGLAEPDTLEQDYDANGAYGEDVPNPARGRPLPEGFNNEKRDLALRAKVRKGPLELGFSLWDKKDGLGSYVVGYEYRTALEDFITHQSGFYLYGRHDLPIRPGRLDLESQVWYRVDQQEPDTGFQYTYRFFDLKKSYHSTSSQFGIEELLRGRMTAGPDYTLGLRFLANSKMDQVVSLGRIQQGGASFTNSSWDIANAGDGLNQAKAARTFQEKEVALYGLLEGELHPKLRYSVGGRWDYGTDYGSTLNPRLALLVEPVQDWLLKLNFGTAFRQPSVFELSDEFRGNPDLEPEKIQTLEFETDVLLEGVAGLFENMRFQFNAFTSRLTDTIVTVPDPTRVGDERFDNIEQSRVRGLSSKLMIQPVDSLLLGLNHMYLQGRPAAGRWGDIGHVATHKLNAVVNAALLDSQLNLNLRLNHVGRRKVPASNAGFDDYAPGYTKLNLALTLKTSLAGHPLEPQLVVSNLLDEQYFGVGRQAGSGDVRLYDPAGLVNPPGFIPPYHPQPGRRFFIGVRYSF